MVLVSRFCRVRRLSGSADDFFSDRHVKNGMLRRLAQTKLQRERFPMLGSLKLRQLHLLVDKPL
jgi:hypothetical protein